jgi:hypothetical protein
MGFWVAVVGTLASAGIATKFGLDINDINKKLDPYRGKDLTNDPVASRTVHDLEAQGNKDYVLQWVFVGLGGAFFASSAVLFYKGYLSSEGSQQSASNHGLNHGLRIFPTASASAGGIIAEFDF